METAIALRYLGGGALPDVPARDLTPEDLAAIDERCKQLGSSADARAWLLASGLYAEPLPAAPARQRRASSDAQPAQTAQEG